MPLYLHTLSSVSIKQSLDLVLSLLFSSHNLSLFLSLSLKMKRAKVSAVYKGKERRHKEEGNSPKKARQRAKARKYGSKENARTRCSLPNIRTIATRSMATLSNFEVEKENQEMGKVMVEVEEEEEKKSKNNVVVMAKPVGGVVEMLEEELKALDWPLAQLSYEEEYWLGGQIKWDPYWDVMTGDFWLGGEGLEPNDWVIDNIWDY